MANATHTIDHSFEYHTGGVRHVLLTDHPVQGLAADDARTLAVFPSQSPSRAVCAGGIIQ